MTTVHAPQILRLKAGEIRAWHPARGIGIEVMSGRIWLTREDDVQDHFVAAGGTIAVGPAVHAVIEADGDVVLRIRTGHRGFGPWLIALLRRMRPRCEVREVPYAWVPG
jgi:hypothetical protein